MDTDWQDERGSDRDVLLSAAIWFAENAAKLDGVLRIALIGSICTPKKDPKDVDLLVSVCPGMDVKPLAKLTRQIQGRIQRGSLGADVFVAEEGSYIGRACSYRDPWPRVRCTSGGNMCAAGRPYLCNTDEHLRIHASVIAQPSVVLWPKVVTNTDLPDDVMKALRENNKSGSIFAEQDANGDDE